MFYLHIMHAGTAVGTEVVTVDGIPFPPQITTFSSPLSLLAQGNANSFTLLIASKLKLMVIISATGDLLFKL